MPSYWEPRWGGGGGEGDDYGLDDSRDEPFVPNPDPVVEPNDPNDPNEEKRKAKPRDEEPILGPQSDGTDWMGWLERQRRGQLYDDPYSGSGDPAYGKAGWTLGAYGAMRGMDTSGIGARQMAGMPADIRKQMATDLAYQLPFFGNYSGREQYNQGQYILNDLTRAGRTGTALRDDDRGRTTFGSTLRRYGNYGR